MMQHISFFNNSYLPANFLYNNGIDKEFPVQDVVKLTGLFKKFFLQKTNFNWLIFGELLLVFLHQDSATKIKLHMLLDKYISEHMTLFAKIFYQCRC